MPKLIEPLERVLPDFESQITVPIHNVSHPMSLSLSLWLYCSRAHALQRFRCKCFNEIPID